MIDYVEGHIVYENPKPHVRSRHGYFPGLVQLPSGEILALFVIAEAFEAADATTWIARSRDDGRTWMLEDRVCARPQTAMPTSDYLKPTLLRNGSLLAVGYRFHRENPEEPIGIAKTGGLLPGDDIVCRSNDSGHTWTTPEIIPRTRPELLELSGPALELTSGDVVAVAALCRMPDGSNPSGQVGVLLRSRDGGRTWDDRSTFFTSPTGHLMPLESRIVEMEPGRLAVISWAFDYRTEKSHTNHVVVSHDDGRTWSEPIDTGHMGQASNLLWLGDRMLSIHAHREGEVGIYVRLIDFSSERWNAKEERVIYGAPPQASRAGRGMIETFSSLRFGQPSLLRLANGDVLATHWSIEDGQGKIRTHRLRV
jgi:sialidase-1